MLSGFELYPRWLPLLILPKRTCAQLRTRTSTSISLKKCYVKLEFQILYAGEQLSSLIFKAIFAYANPRIGFTLFLVNYGNS